MDRVNPGIWKVVGPPSCGKSRFVKSVYESMLEEEDRPCEMWPYSPFGKATFLRLVMCLERDVTNVIPWFGKFLVDEHLNDFCSRYKWAATFPVNTPTATKIRIIKERLALAIETTEKSLRELEQHTIAPVKKQDLEIRRDALRQAVSDQTELMALLDEKGRHEDAARAFRTRSDIQADLRRIVGALEAHEASHLRRDRKPAIERSLKEVGEDLAKAENLTTSLAGLQKRMSLEVAGFIEEFTGIKVTDKIPTELSSTEDTGVRLAVAIALKMVTGFPFVLCENDHIPEKADKWFTGELEARLPENEEATSAVRNP